MSSSLTLRYLTKLKGLLAYTHCRLFDWCVGDKEEKTLSPNVIVIKNLFFADDKVKLARCLSPASLSTWLIFLGKARSLPTERGTVSCSASVALKGQTRESLLKVITVYLLVQTSLDQLFLCMKSVFVFLQIIIS